MKDPRVHQDGKCALPGCAKARPPISLKERDPFCSATCCRAYHGVLWKTDEKEVAA